MFLWPNKIFPISLFFIILILSIQLDAGIAPSLPVKKSDFFDDIKDELLLIYRSFDWIAEISSVTNIEIGFFLDVFNPLKDLLQSISKKDSKQIEGHAKILKAKIYYLEKHFLFWPVELKNELEHLIKQLHNVIFSIESSLNEIGSFSFLPPEIVAHIFKLAGVEEMVKVSFLSSSMYSFITSLGFTHNLKLENFLESQVVDEQDTLYLVLPHFFVLRSLDHLITLDTKTKQIIDDIEIGNAPLSKYFREPYMIFTTFFDNHLQLIYVDCTTARIKYLHKKELSFVCKNLYPLIGDTLYLHSNDGLNAILNLNDESIKTLNINLDKENKHIKNLFYVGQTIYVHVADSNVKTESIHYYEKNKRTYSEKYFLKASEILFLKFDDHVCIYFIESQAVTLLKNKEQQEVKLDKIIKFPLLSDNKFIYVVSFNCIILLEQKTYNNIKKIDCMNLTLEPKFINHFLYVPHLDSISFIDKYDHTVNNIIIGSSPKVNPIAIGKYIFIPCANFISIINMETIKLIGKIKYQHDFCPKKLALYDNNLLLKSKKQDQYLFEKVDITNFLPFE